MIPKEITKEHLLDGYKQYLTVGELKEFLYKNNIPNNSKVLVQRVEDVSYKKHGWGVYLKEGEHTFIDDSGAVVKETLEQYHPAWSCVQYKDDIDMLFIDLRY